MRELIDARGREEALEAEDARVVQRGQPAETLGHRAAPEADVDVRRRCRRRPLDLESGCRRRRRQGVQRHVDDRGHAPGRGREGGGAESLPLRAPGLVDVHVRVDEAGQQHGVVGHERRLRVRHAVACADDVDDAAVLDHDRRRLQRIAQERPAASDHETLGCGTHDVTLTRPRTGMVSSALHVTTAAPGTAPPRGLRSLYTGETSRARRGDTVGREEQSDHRRVQQHGCR